MSLIITLTGMSTSGKSTLAKSLSASDHFSEAVSVTTRPMRPGEVDGVDYHFVTDDQFNEYVEQGVLLEHVRSHHAAYGVPAFEVDKILAQGKSPVLVLEPVGVQSIHAVAKARGYNFMAAYVHTDIAIIMNRFANRIHQQITLGKDVNYNQEAKRLHTILTIEKTWVDVWPWDLTLLNLHRDNNLEGCLSDFSQYHSASSGFGAVDSQLSTSVPVPSCKKPQELALLIELAIKCNMPADEFYREARKVETKTSAVGCFEITP
jgi:guanylate kinase